jgi:hypothetical protein
VGEEGVMVVNGSLRRGGWFLAAAAAAAALVLLWRSRPGSPAALAPAPPFVNVAREAGIDFAIQPRGGMLNILATAGSGGAFLDYNRDGFLDVLLLGKNRCAAYRNLGNGRFEKATGVGLPPGGHWTGCAAADWDNDGFPDLFLNGYGCVRLLRNEHGRRFVDATSLLRLPPPAKVPLFGTSAAWGDVDRDGWLDLYVARYVRFAPGMREFCRARSGILQTCNPDHYAPQTGSLFRSVGGRRFVDVTRATGADGSHGKTWGAAFLDFDADGWQDLYLANDEMAGDLLWNHGGKRFENVAIDAGCAFDPDGRVHGAMGVDAGDYDRDGRVDLLVTAFVNEPYSLYRNNDGRTFTDQAAPAGLSLLTTPYSGWGTKLFDWDNDGWLDVFFANGHATDIEQRPAGHLEQPMQLFRNSGQAEPPAGTRRLETRPHQGVAHFTPVALGLLARPIDGRGAAFGDYDNDGFTDILVVNLAGPPLLLHNETARRSPRAHWLGLALRGRRSNRDGIGARVTLHAGGQARVVEVQSGGSVFSAHDPRPRFGLGALTVVDDVEIRWPSGARDHLRNPPVDRYLTLEEGSSPGD